MLALFLDRKNQLKIVAFEQNRPCQEWIYKEVSNEFLPIGAHKSGRIGEDPNGIPNNLLSYISQVAVGKLDELNVFGNDYPTTDGTAVRDYIHVADLAIGHLRALENVMSSRGVEAYNLGTGNGNSVLEMVTAFEKASGRNIPYKITARRPGDIGVCYADPTKARVDSDGLLKEELKRCVKIHGDGSLII